DNFIDYGIQITSASDFTIQGNYIGTDKTGLLNHGNGSGGIHIKGGSNCSIGGNTAATRNIISGNNVQGIFIETTDALSADSSNNTIQGNYIGTDATGTAALGNSSAGIFIQDSTNTTIGGTDASVRNVISGNNEGIRLTTRFNGNPIQG